MPSCRADCDQEKVKKAPPHVKNEGNEGWRIGASEPTGTGVSDLDGHVSTPRSGTLVASVLGWSAVPSPDLVPLPSVGRTFTGHRRVRLGDASIGGRLRFDALARYLQDVSNDDTRDAEVADAMAWVVRKTVIEVGTPARFGEELDLITFCSGTGPRWAERRVVITGDHGARIDAATVWVHLDHVTGRPKSLPEEFMATFGAAAGGRTIRARLEHGDPPAHARRDPWTLRAVDFDVLGHMNNAAYWNAVEAALDERRDLRGSLRAELEFGVQIEPGQSIELVSEGAAGRVALWLVGEAGVHASATVERLEVA